MFISGPIELMIARYWRSLGKPRTLGASVGVGAPQLTLEWHCRRFHVGVRYPRHVSFPFVSLSSPVLQVAAWFVLAVSLGALCSIRFLAWVYFVRFTVCDFRYILSCHLLPFLFQAEIVLCIVGYFLKFHVENVCCVLFYPGVSLFRTFDTLHFLSLLCFSSVIYSSIVRLQHLHKICYLLKIQNQYMSWKVPFSLILTRNTSIYIANMND